MAPTPSPNPQLPLFKRVLYNVLLFTFPNVLRITFAISKFFKKRPKANTSPTLIKAYPQTPRLKNRIFYPPDYNSSSSPNLLPLCLSIHGGAFIAGAPFLDDTVNTRLSAEWNVLIISLDYPKAPRVQYPEPTEQLVKTILAIFEDESLPFDRSRVAISGYSAGGQLAFSVALHPQMKGKIRAVTAFYPVLDFTLGAAARRDTRPYPREVKDDPLLKIVPLVNYGYAATGQDMAEPGLSPGFARREDLPEWICNIGAELDILCCEAGAMMGRLAGKELVPIGGTEGLAGEDRNRFEAEDGRLKWIMVKGAIHGFTHNWGDEEDPRKSKKDSDETFKAVGAWLWNGPFKQGK